MASANLSASAGGVNGGIGGVAAAGMRGGGAISMAMRGGSGMASA